MKTLQYILLFAFAFQFSWAQKNYKNYYTEYESIPNYLKSKEEAELFYQLFSKKVLSDYQKEKVYAQTNHVFFKPGEELFYKVSVVNAQNNAPSFLSKIVSVEIIDPSGIVVNKRKLQVLNGYAKGNFYFPEDVKGGIYKLRVYTNYMQNEVGKNYFEKELTVQKTSSPRILMKLDFPKKGLSAGEEVIADFSLKNLSNDVIPFYQFTYEVYIAGKEVLKNEVSTNKEGKIQLKFNLPKDLETTDVLLNIRVNYDGFKESISRNVPVTLNKVDLFFFPEGGSLANNISTKIAFKALNEFGQPVDVKGELLDENQQKISEFEAYKFGMGKFDFTPRNGKKYFVKIFQPNISKLFELPSAKDNSVVLNAEKIDGKIILKIQSNENKALKLVGNFRNKEVFRKEFYLSKKEVIQLDEKDFPSGICRFTILNKENIPLCERVIYLNKSREMQVKITPNKNSFIPREKVELNIETLDENGKPIAANLGLSVIDDKLWTYADDRQNNIFSWLQMDSEIVGKIEEPSFYFKKDEPKADEALDLVMLTNAYRYFELLPEISDKKLMKFDYEKSNSVYGKVIDDKGKEAEAEVFLMDYGIEPKVLKQNTKNARFYFTDFPSGRDYQLVAKPKNVKQKISIKVLAFHLDGEIMITENELKSSHKEGKEFEKIEENFKERALEKIQNKTDDEVRIEDKRYSGVKRDSIKTKDIEEVVAIGYGMARKKDVTSSVVSVSRNEINANIVQSLSGRVAGLEVTQNSGIPGNAANIRIRGAASVNGNQPLFVIDGVIVDKVDTNFNTNDIKNISVLKDASATSIYGSKAANGVIIINTIDGIPYNAKKINFSKNNFAYFNISSGYLKNNDTYERVFTYPVYQDTKTLFRDDFRETIYWNPVIQTDKNGKAKVEFYNSDANTTFRMITEGSAYNGLLGRTEKTYAVKSNLQIDAKIPQYITMADQPEIPLVIKNNTDKIKKINLNYYLPKNVELLKKDSLITLKPLENKRLLLSLISNKNTDSNLQISAITDEERETQVLPLKVEPKGFRHFIDFSVNKDTVYKFNVLDRTIDDNTFYRLRIFKNTANKILNDLDRLLEEPHGCFEQTSSTTYPNYFVLQYLKSKGKVDENLEQKALRNLKHGYNRLVNFETSENGFSLFGSKPANVSLTAFGLLEFNDLKNVINVDEKMLERTKKFVLSKRNPNGTFNLSDYESYGTKTEYYWAKQAYILYALASIGLKNEISKQYEVILNHNKATGDAYQMALLANVAFDLGKKQDYKTLTEKLYHKFAENKLKSETNFMEGSGKSLSAEVLALYANSLLKSDKEQLNLTKIIDQLELSDGYYSTQSKVLVLKALSSYYSKFNVNSSNAEPIVKLNGEFLKEEQVFTNDLLKNGQNLLEISYPKGKGLPINFYASYFSLQPQKDENASISMDVTLSQSEVKIGDNVRMNIKIENKENRYLGMITTKIGVPAGLTIQPKLLKDMMEKKEIAYYEIFDNYLVLYWYKLEEKASVNVNLDLKAEFSGKYIGKANKVYEYYKPENYQWKDGVEVKIND
jgi:TonB-dependent SusC/RagA subfamily outer membrane receptor